ncbi:glycosyltransferase family 2 protein [Brachyspira pilosicoli]|uniref:glycosyltransferase family 2 protein n=1 Tax=Brachyspira pilosicoli TaxID=52584 RepID=UPI001CA50061|nr:glycosyltransferase family 2 protein [Brachyspira pilosicoli]MBW5396607.1 glycosyltransferase family 2 protein [Brachyspira pilosicoli]
MLREIPDYKIEEFFEKKHKYCVGIPLLNEGEKIKKELKSMLDNGIHNIADIIIFDGGSNDGSTNKDFLKSVNVRTLLIKTGAGKQGAQFRMGFDYILNQGYDGIITIDGNNKDGVEYIKDFIKKLEEGYDFIQGSRFIKGGIHKNTPISRYLAVKLMHAPWISFMSGFKYTDTTSAYRGISKKLLLDENLNIFRNIFSGYELLFYMSAMAPKLKYKVCEIPVSRIYPKNTKVPTKITFSGNFNIIKTLFKLNIGVYNIKKK